MHLSWTICLYLRDWNVKNYMLKKLADDTLEPLMHHRRRTLIALSFHRKIWRRRHLQIISIIHKISKWKKTFVFLSKTLTFVCSRLRRRRTYLIDQISFLAEILSVSGVRIPLECKAVIDVVLKTLLKFLFHAISKWLQEIENNLRSEITKHNSKRLKP